MWWRRWVVERREGIDPMGIHEEMVELGDRAVAASRELARLTARKKNGILQAMADEIEARREGIKAANAVDVAAAKALGMTAALVDRLTLTDSRINAMAKDLREVSGLKDPVGGVISRWIRPNGLEIVKVRVPIGVIAMIYEARPNVTADAAGLCFKAANAVILRGGKESMQSNVAIVEALKAGGLKKGMPANAIQLVATTDRP